MFVLTKSFTFEASHVLPKHSGKCGRLHGHSWKMTVVIESDKLIESGPSSGMVVDFYDLSAAVKPLLENRLDHYHLNESTQLESPTSEALAQWIFFYLKNSIPLLTAVSVEETCTSKCTYRP